MKTLVFRILSVAGDHVPCVAWSASPHQHRYHHVIQPRYKCHQPQHRKSNLLWSGAGSQTR